MVKFQVVVVFVLMFKLFVNVFEFYFLGYFFNYIEFYEDGCEDYFILLEYVQDFLNYFIEQFGSFEIEIEQFVEILNGCVIIDDVL